MLRRKCIVTFSVPMPFKEYRTASACHLHGSTTIVKTGTYAGTGLALSRKGPSMASADLSGSCEYSHPLSQSYSGFESIILELFQVGDCLRSAWLCDGSTPRSPHHLCSALSWQRQCAHTALKPCVSSMCQLYMFNSPARTIKMRRKGPAQLLSG